MFPCNLEQVLHKLSNELIIYKIILIFLTIFTVKIQRNTISLLICSKVVECCKLERLTPSTALLTSMRSWVQGQVLLLEKKKSKNQRSSFTKQTNNNNKKNPKQKQKTQAKTQPFINTRGECKKKKKVKFQAPFLCLNCKPNILVLPLRRKLISQSKINGTLMPSQKRHQISFNVCLEWFSDSSIYKYLHIPLIYK